MKKISVLSLTFLFTSLTVLLAQSPGLSKREKNQGWILLFDGRSFNGWQKSNGQKFTGEGWKIADGILSTNPKDGHGGDIVTTQEFSDFELSIDFKLEKGANSGVKYSLFKNTSLGCEYQLIDDANHPDAKLGINGNRSLASLYDIMPASGDKKAMDVGEWNNMNIIKKGKHVEHWLNGTKVLEYDRGSEEFMMHLAESKFKAQANFAEVPSSPILLQEHGDVIHFRNIKIKNLKL